MSDSVQFTVRGPKSWEAQLDALKPVVEASSPHTAAIGRVTRSTVLRVVVEAGLRALDAPAAVAPSVDPRQEPLPLGDAP
jgi:hypothetical protein